MKRVPKNLRPIFFFAIPGLVLVLLLLTGTIKLYRMPTRSMTPTLVPGDCMLVTRHFRADNGFLRGNLVVFKAPIYPNHPFIKRITALPGDRIEVLGGHLAVNGTLFKSPAGLNTAPPVLPQILPPGWRRLSFPLTVPEGHVFLMGDNYANSLDSRYFGPVPIDSITHIPKIIVFPPKRFGRLE